MFALHSLCLMMQILVSDLRIDETLQSTLLIPQSLLSIFLRPAIFTSYIFLFYVVSFMFGFFFIVAVLGCVLLVYLSDGD